MLLTILLRTLSSKCHRVHQLRFKGKLWIAGQGSSGCQDKMASENLGCGGVRSQEAHRLKTGWWRGRSRSRTKSWQRNCSLDNCRLEKECCHVACWAGSQSGSSVDQSSRGPPGVCQQLHAPQRVACSQYQHCLGAVLEMQTLQSHIRPPESERA